ncbi:RNA recognition motif 2-domain-containing protein [Irpex lacteus]|nr:RNA recognition motif 2-domain-containing protein [Irpex lacteus]
MSHGAHPITPPPSVPDKNILNVDSIASGGDTRTTVMIKNIPNKMTDEDLLSFINRVSPGRIDFFYLRMDFTNGCNVGYAFVNFITPEDLLHFARTQLGVKWNMYSSEKVLQLSYANYQGKEALVEKFRNSGIMDERPAWRPRIFYSSGHHQGMPQPFPQPTHLRRKERSANNRGTLFVPAPAALGPRQHHVHAPPPAYWGPPGFGYGGCQWVPQ